ncbi:unnamed protein product, partial [marine sediment metagenome]
MRLFNWLSGKKNTSQEHTLIEPSPGVSVEGLPLPADLESICEILKLHTKDIRELFTATNRIERRQNRWLELLNVKEAGQQAVDRTASGPEVAETLLEPGQVAGPQLPGFLS